MIKKKRSVIGFVKSLIAVDNFYDFRYTALSFLKVTDL